MLGLKVTPFNENMMTSSFSVMAPFVDAYVHADWIGKAIFLGLFLLSVLTWGVLCHALTQLRRVKREANEVRTAFSRIRENPLSMRDTALGSLLHPFAALYRVLRDAAAESLEKNHHALKDSEEHKEGMVYLSAADMNLLHAQLSTTATRESQALQQYLYILSTVVSLAPFLGLLGTVWGILTTFSDMQTHSAAGASHQAVLHGLSLALATTVVGLLDAIPALIGYNYLKQRMQHFSFEMEDFSQEMLACVELQYRSVDLRGV